MLISIRETNISAKYKQKQLVQYPVITVKLKLTN